MVWLLFRAFCCLCSNRQSLSDKNRGQYYYYYQDSSDEDEDEDYTDEDDNKAQARAVKTANLKRNAIDLATDVIVAEDLLRRHGDDSTLRMYHDKCTEEMQGAFDKLHRSHWAPVKRPHMSAPKCRRHMTGFV